jgi:hypothetical protein
MVVDQQDTDHAGTCAVGIAGASTASVAPHGTRLRASVPQGAEDAAIETPLAATA